MNTATRPIITIPLTFAIILIVFLTPSTARAELSFDDINKATRESIVNILCTTRTGGTNNPLSGTGVIIHPSGVILTNAHIAQYFLLNNLWGIPNFIDCVIRSGNPATPKYRAKLLYLSPLWIEKNYKAITETNPQGTGENDFALLMITGGIGIGTEKPTFFPYVLPLIKETSSAKEHALVAGYPAGFIGGADIQKGLFSSSAITFIKESLSYTGFTHDFLLMTGTVVAQKGASGGPVVDKNGNLIALISTVTTAKQTSERYLGAITLGHISRSLYKQTGKTLDGFLRQDLEARASEFASTTLPKIKKTLVDSITK